MGIKQINCTYFPNDDRIIFRFNTTENSEYKFWLTRKVTHFILKTTHQFIEKQYEKKFDVPSVAKAISEFQQQAVQQTTNLSLPYEQAAQYPIGADAILVIDVRNEILTTADQEFFSLDFILPGGGNVNIKLPAHIIRQLVLLLTEINKQANWGDPYN